MANLQSRAAIPNMNAVTMGKTIQVTTIVAKTPQEVTLQDKRGGPLTILPIGHCCNSPISHTGLRHDAPTSVGSGVAPFRCEHVHATSSQLTKEDMSKAGLGSAYHSTSAHARTQRWLDVAVYPSRNVEHTRTFLVNERTSPLTATLVELKLPLRFRVAARLFTARRRKG